MGLPVTRSTRRLAGRSAATGVRCVLAFGSKTTAYRQLPSTPQTGPNPAMSRGGHRGSGPTDRLLDDALKVHTLRRQDSVHGPRRASHSWEVARVTS